jgi:GNAT superfamily N-acetyltransferase
VAILTRKAAIGLLHADPALRQQGIGRALLEALEAQAQSWGLASLRVDATSGARAFFARHGYRDGAIARTVFGIDAVRLSKPIAFAHAGKPACGCGQAP